MSDKKTIKDISSKLDSGMYRIFDNFKVGEKDGIIYKEVYETEDGKKQHLLIEVDGSIPTEEVSRFVKSITRMKTWVQEKSYTLEEMESMLNK